MAEGQEFPFFIKHVINCENYKTKFSFFEKVSVYAMKMQHQI